MKQPWTSTLYEKIVMDRVNSMTSPPCPSMTSAVLHDLSTLSLHDLCPPPWPLPSSMTSAVLHDLCPPPWPLPSPPPRPPAGLVCPCGAVGGGAGLPARDGARRGLLPQRPRGALRHQLQDLRRRAPGGRHDRQRRCGREPAYIYWLFVGCLLVVYWFFNGSLLVLCWFF